MRPRTNTQRGFITSLTLMRRPSRGHPGVSPEYLHNSRLNSRGTPMPIEKVRPVSTCSHVNLLRNPLQRLRRFLSQLFRQLHLERVSFAPPFCSTIRNRSPLLGSKMLMRMAIPGRRCLCPGLIYDHAFGTPDSCIENARIDIFNQIMATFSSFPVCNCYLF